MGPPATEERKRPLGQVIARLRALGGDDRYGVTRQEGDESVGRVEPRPQPAHDLEIVGGRSDHMQHPSSQAEEADTSQHVVHRRQRVRIPT